MIWNRLKPSDPEKERQFREQMKDVKLGWKDKFAMVFSAMLVLLLPSVLLLVGMCLLMLWIFGIL